MTPLSIRAERWLWFVTLFALACIVLTLVATVTACGRPFLRCKELEVGAAGGAPDAGDGGP